jgi:hypothetical protein
MRTLALFIAMSLLAASLHAETRIIELPDRVIVEITGTADTTKDFASSQGVPPASRNISGPQGVAPETPDNSALFDPLKAEFLKGQIDELKRDISDLRRAPQGESMEERNNRYDRIRNKQTALQQYSTDLAAIQSTSTGN